MTPHTDQSDRAPIGRRRMLGLTLAAGLGAVLTGCSSTSSSARSRVGEPIPDLPTYRPLPRGRRPSPLAGSRQAPTGDVQIISRSAWASRGPIQTRADRMGRIQYITVHHDGMAPFGSPGYDDAARRLEAIRNAHVEREWADIGYHYAIDPAGRIWEARPEYLQGAHVKDRNPGNLGILVMGNFERERPTPAALRSLDALVGLKMDANRVGVDRVLTHQEWAATACPGRHLQTHMTVARASGGSIRVAAAARGLAPRA